MSKMSCCHCGFCACTMSFGDWCLSRQAYAAQYTAAAADNCLRQKQQQEASSRCEDAVWIADGSARPGGRDVLAAAGSGDGDDFAGPRARQPAA